MITNWYGYVGWQLWMRKPWTGKPRKLLELDVDSRHEEGRDVGAFVLKATMGASYLSVSVPLAARLDEDLLADILSYPLDDLVRHAPTFVRAAKNDLIRTLTYFDNVLGMDRHTPEWAALGMTHAREARKLAQCPLSGTTDKTPPLYPI